MSKEQDGSKKGKGAVILAIIGVVIAIGVLAVFILLGLKKEYRFVQVESYKGKVNISREAKDIDIFEGLMLIPEDKVSTKKGSMVELLVDDDKHIVAEENTVFTISATGDNDDGKVQIKLKSGKGLFTIDNKLKKNSSFEVKTSNAALSVRGTTFSVKYDDRKETTVEVMEGIVYAETDVESLEILAGDIVIIGDDFIIKNGELFAGELADDSIYLVSNNQDTTDDTKDLEAEKEAAEEESDDDAEKPTAADDDAVSGYVALEQIDLIFGEQVNEAQLTYAMDCILTGQANKRSPVETMGYNLAHSSFTDVKNKDGAILTLLDKQTPSGEIDFYYDLAEVEKLASLMNADESMAERFPGNVSDGRFKAVRYTTVEEDQSKTTTDITGIYVENGTVYVAGEMTMSFSSDPDIYTYKYVAVMEKGPDGNYHNTDAIKGTLADLGY